MKTKAEWAELSKQFEKEYDETDNEICYRLHLLCTLLSLDNTDTDNINKFEEDYKIYENTR